MHGRKSVRLIVMAAAAIMLAWSAALAQEAPSKSLKAVFVTTAPKIDGQLDDACWVAQTPIQDFTTMYPVAGEQPAFQTRVRAAYDNQNLYIAFDIVLPDSLSLTARTLKRDDGQVNYDDCFFVYLDCMDDKRSCYFFGVNALGTQYDGHAEGEGSKSDLRWDGVWPAATTSSLRAWAGELAIPFRILRYNKNTARWGINFLADLQGRQISYWAETGMNPARASKYGDLIGLEQIQAGARFNVFPYAAYDHDEEAKKKDEARVGVDVKYDPTNALTLNLTANPDYAQIEADVDEFNLFPKERLIQEKRPFFLEGLELFRTPLTLFYTRAIGSRRERENPVDILGGAKLVGRVGKFSLGGMNVLTDKAEGVNRQSYSAFRLQRDVLKSSTVGILGTATHEFTGGIDENRWLDGALAMDSYVALGKDIGLYPMAAVIHHGNTTPDSDPSPYGEDDWTLYANTDDWAYYLALQRMGSAALQYTLRFQDISDGFTSSTAYIPFRDIRGGTATLDYSWWVRKHGFYRLNPYGSYEQYWNHDDQRAQRNVYLGFGAQLEKMINLYVTRYEYEFLFPKRGYDNFYDFWEAYADSRTLKRVVGSVTYRVGTQYYYLAQAPGLRVINFGDKWYRLRKDNWDNSYRHLIFSSQLKPLDRLQVDVNVENVHFDFLTRPPALADTTSSEWIVSVRSHLMIMPTLSFKAFYQDNRKDKTTDVNLLVEYNFLPGSYLYVAYNHNEDVVGLMPAASIREEDLFFVKINYWLNF